MHKQLLWALFLTLSWVNPVWAYSHSFCMRCQRVGYLRCTFKSNSPLGPKPGRFFCKTYLSEALNDQCNATPYPLLKCGLKPHTTLEAGGFSDQEWSDLNKSHLRSWAYICVKAVVNLLEWISPTNKQIQRHNPSLSKTKRSLDHSLTQVKTMSQQLIHQEQQMIGLIATKVHAIKQQVQTKIQQTRDTPQE